MMTTRMLRIFIATAGLFLFLSVLHLSFGYEYKFIYVLSAAALFTFCLSFSRVLYVLLLTIYLLLGLIYGAVGINYGYPDVNAVGSLMYTDNGESLEYIAGLPFKTYLYLAGLLVSAGCALLMKPLKKRHQRIVLFTVFFITAFWSSSKDYIQGKSEGFVSVFKSGLPEIRFFRDSYESYVQIRKDNLRYAKVIETSDHWNPQVTETGYDTYILVIGESVRKDFMHAFGFELHPNTPWMSSRNGLFFDNYISASGSTTLSLTNALAVREGNVTNLSDNLVALANKAGFHTYWISNQHMKGIYDSPVGVMGKKAGFYHFLAPNRSDKGGPDEMLLPFVRDALAEKNGKKLIVVHLIGSHPQPCGRLTENFDKFIGSRNISCYIKSIENTDKLLSDIAVMAGQEHQRWTMAYFSDHGLLFTDKGTENTNLTHGDSMKQNFQVPFFITAFDAQSQNRITHFRSGLSMLPLLSQWMGIKEAKLDNHCDWLRDTECTGQKSVVNFKNELKSFDSLPEDNLVLH
ncbi:phosphoethanolamine transferase [Morganella morganii]|uniref:phosphoethanolamine transferase n=1 Tax=Morganella morganii TaxID=582 RepID=UPI001CBD5267|nr:phosphoethanolamine transferase [Morganella morganii]MCW3200685.1 phosphoethanolamine transferase [Morganella morganii]WOZ89993.1 phosphoethanolamine transferase [Morganella morganii]